MRAIGALLHRSWLSAAVSLPPPCSVARSAAPVQLDVSASPDPACRSPYRSRALPQCAGRGRADRPIQPGRARHLRRQCWASVGTCLRDAVPGAQWPRRDRCYDDVTAQRRLGAAGMVHHPHHGGTALSPTNMTSRRPPIRTATSSRLIGGLEFPEGAQLPTASPFSISPIDIGTARLARRAIDPRHSRAIRKHRGDIGTGRYRHPRLVVAMTFVNTLAIGAQSSRARQCAARAS